MIRRPPRSTLFPYTTLFRSHVPAQPPEAKPIACCDLVNRGLAYHPSGKLFIELLAGDLLALDAKTGKQLWRGENADYKEGSNMKNGRGVCLGRVLISWGAVSFNKKKR